MPQTRSFPSPPHAHRALVLRAHPQSDSFNHAVADAWTAGAHEGGLTVRSIDLASLNFDPRLHVAYKSDQPLEPDLVRLQSEIAEAAHLVFAFPVWWGSTPATLKGLFDRTFLPGWAFTHDKGRPVPGLAGRSGRLLVTMDAPTWYDRWVYRGSARRQVGRATLQFCGVHPVKISAFGSIRASTAAQRASMVAAAEKAGRADALRLVRRGSRRVRAAADASQIGST